jgi:hypothetical protein
MCISLGNARSPGHPVKPDLPSNSIGKETRRRRRKCSLLLDQRPVDSNDSFVRKAFQRFGKNQISRASSFFESWNSKICPALAFLNGHHPILLYLRLKMTIARRFLPKGVNLRFTTFFDYLRKARRFHFEELHILIEAQGWPSRPRRDSIRLHSGQARSRSTEKDRQRTTARRIRLPLLHSCPGGVRKSSIHSP